MYDKCPLKEAGFTLITFTELPPMIILDGKCICTKRCIDPDKKDSELCSLEQLKTLDNEAIRRRAYQSGEDY